MSDDVRDTARKFIAVVKDYFKRESAPINIRVESMHHRLDRQAQHLANLETRLKKLETK